MPKPSGCSAHFPSFRSTVCRLEPADPPTVGGYSQLRIGEWLTRITPGRIRTCIDSLRRRVHFHYATGAATGLIGAEGPERVKVHGRVSLAVSRPPRLRFGLV